MSWQHKTIPNPFDRQDLHPLIATQISTQFRDIYIQVPAVQKGIIPPDRLQNIFPLDDLLPADPKLPQQLVFPIG